MSKTISVTFLECCYCDTSGSENYCKLCDKTSLKRYFKLNGILHPNTKVEWYLCRDCFEEHVNMKYTN